MPNDTEKSAPMAFVIMPFDSEFQPIYDDLIKPALEEIGYEVNRADSFIDQRNILRDIVVGIASADIIVADITTPNPNVYYELGLCHGLQIPTIMIAQNAEDIPFDLKGYRIITYSIRFNEVNKLKEKLANIGAKHLKKEISFESPVTDFRHTEHPITSRNNLPVESLTSPVNEEPEEKYGILDFIVEGVDIASDIEKSMNIITEATQDIGNKMNSRTDAINTISTNPTLGSALHLQKIAKSTAIDMIEYSEILDKMLPEFSGDMDSFMDVFSSYANLLDPTTDEEKTQVGGFKETVEVLLKAVSPSLDSFREFRETVTKIKGISKDINRGVKRVGQSLGNIIDIYEKFEAFLIRIISILDKKV